MMYERSEQIIKEKIVLIGGGGHCHSVIDVIEQTNKYDIIGIIDTKENIGKKVLDYEVIACDDDLETISKNTNDSAVIDITEDGLYQVNVQEHSYAGIYNINWTVTSNR